MARWAERGPVIAEESDLDDYMHEVAGRVGWMLTELFALDVPAVSRHREEMMTLGREFGLALQTVNVIRGLHSDWQRGWVYVPASFVGEGADPGKIFNGGERDYDLETAVLARMVTKAEAHLRSALLYIEQLPARARGLRLFCLLPYFFAVRTLALSRGSERVFVEEVKIPRSEVRRITRAASLLGWSNPWVRWYAGRLASLRGSGPRSPDRRA
jgi:farnesyl-diphosphate farnesyltransferase